MDHTHTPSRRWASVVAAAACAGSIVVTASPVTAADRSVDPASLTPPPADFLNAECTRNGQQIICGLAFVDPVSPVEESIGITCGSGADEFEVLDTWTRSVDGKRVYSADGLLLRRHFNDEWSGTFTNSVTGATVSYSQRGTYLHDVAVPGDSGTGIERTTVRLRVFGDAGTVLMNSGRTVYSYEDDAVLLQAGPHPFDDFYVNGDTAALQPICDALA